mgnify:CR=1 FL=1
MRVNPSSTCGVRSIKAKRLSPVVSDQIDERDFRRNERDFQRCVGGRACALADRVYPAFRYARKLSELIGRQAFSF